MNDVVKVEWIIETGFSGCIHSGVWEIEKDTWLGMNRQEQDELLEEMMQDEIGNHIEAGYRIVEDDS